MQKAKHGRKLGSSGRKWASPAWWDESYCSSVTELLSPFLDVNNLSNSFCWGVFWASEAFRDCGSEWFSRGSSHSRMSLPDWPLPVLTASPCSFASAKHVINSSLALTFALIASRSNGCVISSVINNSVINNKYRKDLINLTSILQSPVYWFYGNLMYTMLLVCDGNLIGH